MYQVKSRKLEEFLHVHMIYWVTQEKDEFGETCWSYEDTAELRCVVAEYKSIVAKKRRISNAEIKSPAGRFHRKFEKQ